MELLLLHESLITLGVSNSLDATSHYLVKVNSRMVLHLNCLWEATFYYSTITNNLRRYHLYGYLGVHCNSQSSSIFFFTRGKGRVANRGDCRKHEYFGDWLKWWCFYRPFSFKCFPSRHYLFEKDCKYITNGLIWCICLYESHQEHYRNESKRTFCNILISVKGSSNSK